MKRYAIWNKKDSILTPVGEVLTAAQWIERYPIAGLDSVIVVCAAGEINGALFATLGSMMNQYEERGCDFTNCSTPEEVLQVIEAYEDAQKLAAAQHAEDVQAAKELRNMSMASIAASMEYQNMLSLEDTEVTE